LSLDATTIAVGNLFINSTANDGPDRTTNGWRRFPNARGMILDIVRRVLSSSPLLSDMNGNFGSTCVEILSRKDELNRNSMEAEISSC